jgi:hypothetical protein
MGRPSRASIKKALDFMPVEVALMGTSHGEMTHKQKVFARELALGTTGAEAYRKAYNTKASKQRQAEMASKLKKSPKIKASVERERAMIEARKQRTPEELRVWVIEQLRTEASDIDNPPSVRVNALLLLGKVTEVAAFTDRKEKVVIHSSLDLRQRIEQSIRELAIDVEAVDTSLEDELQVKQLAMAEEIGEETDPTGEGEGQSDEGEGDGYVHIIPPE